MLSDFLTGVSFVKRSSYKVRTALVSLQKLPSLDRNEGFAPAVCDCSPFIHIIRYRKSGKLRTDLVQTRTSYKNIFLCTASPASPFTSLTLVVCFLTEITLSPKSSPDLPKTRTNTTYEPIEGQGHAPQQGRQRAKSNNTSAWKEIVVERQAYSKGTFQVTCYE